MLSCSKRTRDIYSRAHSKFIEYVGPDCLLINVSPEMAHGFYHVFLSEQNLAPSYRSKTSKIVREFFDKAVKFKLLTENPFKFKLSSEVSWSRHRYIERGDILAVIQAATDERFAAMIAFAGLCGLRARSELAAVCWEHVNWEARVLLRFQDVRQSKEIVLCSVISHAYSNGIFRLQGCPINGLIFPGLSNANATLQEGLRGRLEKLALMFGLSPGMNLRSSAESFLVREGFDIYQVTRWLGNSPEVARKHYLQTTAADIRRATSIGDKKSPHSPRNTEEVGGTGRNTGQEEIKKPVKREIYAQIGNVKAHPGGFEPPTLGSEDRCSIQLSHGCVCSEWILRFSITYSIPVSRF